MRRAFLVWAALPAAIVLGLGGGYLAGSLADDTAAPPAATSAHDHGGHVHSDGQTMSDGEMVSVPPSAPADHGGHSGHLMPDGTIMPGSDPSADMGGMDMGDQATSGHDGHGSHGATAEPPATRPRAVVLGTFGVLNAGVLMTAAVLRRRGRDRRPQRSAR